MVFIFSLTINTQKTTDYIKNVIKAINNNEFAENTLLVIVDKKFDKSFFLDQMSKTIETIEEKLISIKFNIRVLPEKYNSKMKADNGVFTMFFIHSASNYDTYSHSFKFNLIQNWLLSVTASKSDYLHHIDDIEDLKYLLSKSSSFSIFWVLFLFQF